MVSSINVGSKVELEPEVLVPMAMIVTPISISASVSVRTLSVCQSAVG